MHSHPPQDWLDRLPLLIATAVVASVVLYLAAAVRLWRRGDAWPGRYVWSFVGASLAVAAAAVAPLPAGPFTDHMARHLLVGMVAPLLLVLAKPVTLTLRVMRPGSGRQRLLSVLHFRPVGVLLVPVVAAVLDMGRLWLLYRTPLFAEMHHRPVLAAAIHLHMFVAGVLYTAAICQVDPMRRRYSLAARAVILFLAGGRMPYWPRACTPTRPRAPTSPTPMCKWAHSSCTTAGT